MTTGRVATRNDLVGVIVPLNASALENWKLCKRLYRARHLLSLPASDSGRDNNVGLLVHELLRAVHMEECCGDESSTRKLLERVPMELRDLLFGYLARHAQRCPKDAIWSDHEFELARFKRASRGMWMATGKIDAAWAYVSEQGPVLDARDYKTGQIWYERVADDLAARVQAYLLAPLAEEKGLHLRISYEHLDESVTQHPEPFEPDSDDLAAIENELGELALEIARETEFVGIAEPRICSRCSYRSVCPDAVVATPS